MNKIRKILTLENLICLFIIIIYGILWVKKYYDNDLFFDIKTGETIIKYGIDFRDHFSFIPNLTYLYHHWLYDLLVYYINIFFGFFGIKMFFLLIFITFGIIYFINCNSVINNKIIAIITTIIVMFYTSCVFSTRVQSITYILFFIEVLILNKIYETGNRKYLIPLTIISIMIVNMHMPLWILCFVLYLPYLASMIISNIFKKKQFIDKPKDNKLIYLTGIVILLSGIISPYRSIQYTFFIKAMLAESFKIFQISELVLTRLINYKFELLLLLLFILGLYFKVLKVKLRDLFLFLGLFIFSLIAIRNVVFFYIFGPYILLKSIDSKINIKTKFYINKDIFQISILVLLIVLFIRSIYATDIYNNEYKINETYPVEIVNYIKDNIDYKNTRIYNMFSFGSYLEYNDIPVFIDSRAEVYSKEFNGGHDIISDYVDSLELDSYKNVFEEYKFEYAIIENDTDLYQYLKIDTSFEEIMSNDQFTLYKVNISQE